MGAIINIDNKEIPKQDYFLRGKKYIGKIAFVDGFNGHTKANDDGMMCALIEKSAFSKSGKPNILKDKDGNSYHSENRRRQVFEL